MKNFAAEFHALASFYTNLARDLNEILKPADAPDGWDRVQSTLQNRKILEQIPKMSARIAELSDDWARSRAKLDPAKLQEVEAMAAEAASQAVRLQELCRAHTQKLQAIHDEIRSNLSELAKGVRWAKVLKPAPHNYPKFIDSSC